MICVKKLTLCNSATSPWAGSGADRQGDKGDAAVERIKAESAGGTFWEKTRDSEKNQQIFLGGQLI